MTPDADAIDALLPQTHCTQCGYAGCRPYAEALARGEADIDRCPPGDDAGAAALAALLGVAAKPYDRARGTHKPRAVAVIDEATCVGCTKCIQACPVDAIVGASRLMHGVIADECTGCELCIPPCPVDCIAMRIVEPARPDAAWRERLAEMANSGRRRFRARNERLARDAAERADRLAARSMAAPQPPGADPIAAAIARAQAKRRAPT
jgi:electron transport complex protein RnfB